MRYLILILALMWPGLCFGFGVDQVGSIGKTMTDNGGPVVIAENSGSPSGTTYFTTGFSKVKGQSFIPTSTKFLTSIELSVSAFVTGEILVCRAGTSNDLSSNYEEITVPVTSTGSLILQFAGTTELTTGVTYYFGCITTINSDGATMNRTDPVYPDGQLYYGTTVAWTMTTPADFDFIFKVYGQ